MALACVGLFSGHSAQARLAQVTISQFNSAPKAHSNILLVSGWSPLCVHTLGCWSEFVSLKRIASFSLDFSLFNERPFQSLGDNPSAGTSLRQIHLKTSWNNTTALKISREAMHIVLEEMGWGEGPKDSDQVWRERAFTKIEYKRQMMLVVQMLLPCWGIHVHCLVFNYRYAPTIGAK